MNYPLCQRYYVAFMPLRTFEEEVDPDGREQQASKEAWIEA